MKKYFAIVIALIMMMSIVAFADEENIETEEVVEEVVEVVEEVEEVEEEVIEEEVIEEVEETVEEEASEETVEEETAEEETSEEEVVEETAEEEIVEEEQDYTVRFVSNRAGETVEEGETVTLTAIVEGLDDAEYNVRWEYSDDNGATAYTAGNGSTFSFNANAENANYVWRAVVEIEG